MAKSDAEQVIAECTITFATAAKEDCNRFVKTVAAVFFEPDIFTGNDMNADAIIAEMTGSASWKKLNKIHDDAIAAATAGKFVVAGMTSGELGDDHGHLAIIIGVPGRLSGTVVVPICYAGSLNSGARIANERVSGTFGTQNARQSKISYFSRTPDTVPEQAALMRLASFVHTGPVAETPVRPRGLRVRRKKKRAGVRKGGTR